MSPVDRRRGWSVGLDPATRSPWSPWVLIGSFAVAAVLCGALILVLPHGGGDLAAAREAGIVSVTTLQGYSKSADTRNYLLGLGLTPLVAVALWCLWAAFRRPAPADAAVSPAEAPREERRTRRLRPGWRALEWAGVGTLLCGGFLHFDLARNGFTSPWVLLAEEGEMMAWLDAMLRGQVLCRDIFCLYGPFSKYPLVALFQLLGPSLHLWRLWIYALGCASLLVYYALFRRAFGSRGWAVGAALVLGLAGTSGIPAMSWSISRVTLGIAALAVALPVTGSTHRRLVAAGVILASALFFSQEVGIAAAVALAVALAVEATVDRAPRDAGRKALALAAGFAAVAGPFVLYLVARGALSATIDNLFFFGKVRVLGFGGLPFPRITAVFGGGPETALAILRAYAAPAVYAATGTFLLFRIVTRRRIRDASLQLALTVFGGLLFSSALSRPDETHVAFALPPAVVLVLLHVRALGSALAGQERPLAVRFAAALGIVAGVTALAPFAGVALENARLAARQAVLTLTGRFHGEAPVGFRELRLPRAGGINVPAELAAEIEGAVGCVQESTRPGEPFWAFPNEPLLNFLADRPLPSRFGLALFAVTRAQRRQLVDEVERSRPAVAVLYTRTPGVDGIPPSRALPEVAEYFQAHYVFDRPFGAMVVMRRRY